jgi:hypothetical protein
MILDVRFTDAPPVQIQNVRLVTVYPKPDGDAGPEIVIHSYDRSTSQTVIPLHHIVSFAVAND